MQTYPWRSVLAEFIGTFSLVTVGCGAIAVQALTGSLTHLGVALAFGMVVMVMIAATGHISGAHLNPAVTLAFTVTRHFPWRWVGGYFLAQFSGAVLAAVLLRFLFGAGVPLGVTLPSGGLWQAFLLEVLLTAALMFVITAVATDTKATRSTCRDHDWCDRLRQCLLGRTHQRRVDEPGSFPGSGTG